MAGPRIKEATEHVVWGAGLLALGLTLSFAGFQLAGPDGQAEGAVRALAAIGGSAMAGGLVIHLVGVYRMLRLVEFVLRKQANDPL